MQILKAGDEKKEFLPQVHHNALINAGNDEE